MIQLCDECRAAGKFAGYLVRHGTSPFVQLNRRLCA